MPARRELLTVDSGGGKVVKPPRISVARNGRASLLTTRILHRHAMVVPISAQPMMFTANVV